MPINGIKSATVKLQQFYKRLLADIPKIVGTEAVNFFRESFHKQGWHDVGMEPWAPLSPHTHKKRGGAILIESGKLMRSIHIDKMSGLHVTVVCSMPYAKAHNEGFDGEMVVKSHVREIRRRARVRSSNIETRKRTTRRETLTYGRGQVRSHKRKMHIPKRQFMGNSHELNMRIRLAILKHADKLWKSL